MNSSTEQQPVIEKRAPAVALLVIGVIIVLRLGLTVTWQQGSFLLAALVLILVPGTRNVIAFAMNIVRKFIKRRLNLSTFLVFVATAAYLLIAALMQGRYLFPKSHDSQAHLLQATMIAHGHLWMPQHPLADFFETFFVLVKPVYAPIFFPGTSLVNVPAIWLHLPYWVIPWLISSAGVAAVFRLGAELLDGIAGLLMSLLVLACVEFRMLSFDLMSHPLMMLLGTLMLLIFLRWWRRGKVVDIALLGAVSGLAAITRPDSLCYAIPIVVAVIWRLLATRGASPAAKWKMVVIGILFALPFLALQLIFNHGTTGRWFETPYTLYLHEFQPGTEAGFSAFNPEAKPQTQLLQKQSYFQRLLLRDIRRHTFGNALQSWLGERGQTLVKFVYGPAPMVVCLLPLALLGLRDVRRLVAMLPLLLMWCLYTTNPVYLNHYPVGFLAPLGLAMVIAIEQTRRISSRLPDVLTLALLAMFVAGLPEISGAQDEWLAPTMIQVHDDLPKKVKTPAVVLFSYKDDLSANRPLMNFHEEPVFNSDVLNPDDALIIKAHDLGLERDRAIFDYYAKRQPSRNFYLFDRLSSTISPLGTARELAEKYPMK